MTTLERLRRKTSGSHIALGQKMIKSGVNRDAALGALILNGSYNDRCKVFKNWERVIEKYM